ncbi:MAG: tripartite tricarboxylate transporter substrate binding protein [Alcaligenaceae bacterium]|nr:tripartite tricarboxylate transporter substrate binding protein [Alcaligenaceae bacterium]
MSGLFNQRRKTVKFLAATMISCVPFTVSWADAGKWPEQAINFVVPFPPGGPVDTAARIATASLADQWKQSTVIDNKAGAGGIVGARFSAKAKPDGYNYFFTAIHHAILPSLNDNLGYDAQKDFEPVGGVARFPLILVAHPSLNVKSVQELIALAKEKPNTISYSSSGTGGGTHLAGELFASMAGVQLQHIPYKGSAPAVQDLVGGQVQLMFADATSALPFIKTGKVIPLGVGNKERSALSPDVPTIAESGLPGYEAYSWSGLFAPKGTPADVIAKLNADLNASLNSVATEEKMNGSGSEPMPMSPEDFGQFLDAEIKKWHDTIQKANIKVQG